MKQTSSTSAKLQRAQQTLTLLFLAIGALALCVACSAKREEPTVFERGTWALSTFEGRQAPSYYSILNYKFDYNEHGQIVESRKSTNVVNIITGQTSYCTWADDGLSYEFSYVLTTGNFGENGGSGTSKATFEVEYNELSATYTAHGESVIPTWGSNDDMVRCKFEYRPDGALKRKEVEGYESLGSLEIYEYDERGDLARYELTRDGEDVPTLIRTYDVTYEDDVPKSVVVTRTNPATSDDETGEGSSSDNSATYELELITDENGNVTSAVSDGWALATMSWVYIETPDPLSRLRIQAEAGSVFDLL